MIFGRRRFAELIERQLDLFQQDNVDLLAETQRLLERYNNAGRDEAEARFGDYQDALETGTELLADARDSYALTLIESLEERYKREFNAAVARRLPSFSLELENR